MNSFPEADEKALRSRQEALEIGGRVLVRAGER
jgi:hypothetical protein